MSSTFFAIIIVSLLLSTFADNCISTEWTYCAAENGNCNIVAVSAGYISICGGGQCNLIYFVNNKTSWSVPCNVNFGDPRFGYTKTCCYISTEPKPNDPYQKVGFNWYGSAEGPFGVNQGWWDVDSDAEGTYWVTSGINAVAYGTDAYFFRLVSGGYACANAGNRWFQDPDYGKTKSCWWGWGIKTYPPEWRYISTSDFENCGSYANGQKCTGLTTEVPTWVRYGSPATQWLYKLIYTSTGELFCNDMEFGTVLTCPGNVCSHADQNTLYCEAIKDGFYISGVSTGTWVSRDSCSGSCGALTHVITISNSYSQTKTVTDTFTTTISDSIKEGVSFEGVGVDDTLSLSVSLSLAESLSSTITRTTTTTDTVTCEGLSEGTLFQWEQSGSMRTADSSTSDWTLNPNIVFCSNATDPTILPKCPPGYCQQLGTKDGKPFYGSCLTCSQDIYKGEDVEFIDREHESPINVVQILNYTSENLFLTTEYTITSETEFYTTKDKTDGQVSGYNKNILVVSVVFFIFFLNY